MSGIPDLTTEINKLVMEQDGDLKEVENKENVDKLGNDLELDEEEKRRLNQYFEQQNKKYKKEKEEQLRPIKMEQDFAQAIRNFRNGLNQFEPEILRQYNILATNTKSTPKELILAAIQRTFLNSANADGKKSLLQVKDLVSEMNKSSLELNFYHIYNCCDQKALEIASTHGYMPILHQALYDYYVKSLVIDPSLKRE